MEAQALNVVHDTNKAATAISERGSEDHVAHLLFRHDYPRFCFVRKSMWTATGFFAEDCRNSQKPPNKVRKNCR
jgi:hypothetical protein